VEAGIRQRSCEPNGFARSALPDPSSARQPNYVMIDLEVDSLGEAEAFLRTVQQIWGGPGKAVMQNPSGRIADVVEEGTTLKLVNTDRQASRHPGCGS
jgi:hypothetical protein